MDDKTKERCKTSEEQCMQEDLDRSRGVEMLSSQPRWIEKLSRSYRGDRSFLNRSTMLLRRCRNCNKKQLKSLTDSQVSRRCRDYLKTVFQEGKNTDMNVIKHATQPTIQSTF